jgi:hypothetical protein
MVVVHVDIYDIEKASATELFNIPLRDVRVVWGEDIYVYTIPTATQEGYVYKVVGNKLEYVTGGSYGLMVFDSSGGLAITRTLESETHTEILDKDIFVFNALIPEKCVNTNISTVCAQPENTIAGSFPDDWYKGVISYSDSLWKINVELGESTLLSNLSVESGRNIDVVKIGATQAATMYYFINKNDNSLWLYDASLNN